MLDGLAHVPKVEARAALLSLGLSVTLVGVKFAAYFLTGSAAIFSDAVENVVNVLAASFALYALNLAHTPPDEDHPYGHGKIEFLSASFEGGLIVLAGLVILYKAVANLVTGNVEVESLGWGVALTAAAMAANGVVGWYLIRLGRRRTSATLEADGHHLLSDTITSAGALIALAIVHFTGFAPADPIGAMLMAGYMLYLGSALLRKAGGGLMDRQDAEDHRIITSVLDAHLGLAGKEPRVCSYHKLRHRHSGRYHWVDFHLVLPPDVGLETAHNVASAIEHEIQSAIGEGNATAHTEPCRDSSCELCQAHPDVA